MVDFKKKLGKMDIEKKINPKEIYDTLDRKSDKGPLRPIQEKILDDWFDNFSNKRDVILKMHTGQGKTLTGLLILQSRLNQNKGPALYLCHNNYLVEQTCRQAESFGLQFCTVKDEIPDQFIDGKKILITSVQMLFNGLTKFKLGTKSLDVATILMDDAHACIEVIKNACKMVLKQGTPVYQDILELFSSELQNQGVGTFADIKQKSFDALLCVPYWDWQDKHTEVANKLSKYTNLKEIKFAWPVIKNILKDCQCYISGTSIEIIPVSIPLHLFGSYYKAEHRIFMSATITDDSFFIKGLGLDTSTIVNPLHVSNEKWSGEKMVLIPSLIDSELSRTEIVNAFAKPQSGRKEGIVSLVPSGNYTKDWEKYGSKIANTDSIFEDIKVLKENNRDTTLVIVNRYDGIDLPDESCRILILDSKPYFESLQDRHLEECRSNSDIVAMRMAQTIEQGLGRAVRGEKDYCVIIVTGTELVKSLRNKKYFSQQTRTQINIGFKVAEFAKEEIEEGTSASDAFMHLIQQSLNRDEGWKDFYIGEMNKMIAEERLVKTLEIFELEKKAEDQYSMGEYKEAGATIQKLIDSHIDTEEEKGWYFQEIARMTYAYSSFESNKYQILAHRKNTYLLKPREGMEITKLLTISLKRIENIIKWAHSFNTYEELYSEVDDLLSKLRFGVNADRFEQAFHELGKIVGFETQRPDKEWKEGPDNIWKISDSDYFLVECKNNVSTSRTEINKDETGQMNNACAWFMRNYKDITPKRIMIIPARKISSAAGFTESVQLMRDKHLRLLVNNVRRFFQEFRTFDLSNLSDDRIQRLIITHKLTAEDLKSELYSEEPRM
ncbi:DEAD/DEAH box helicase family protein [Paenibacillus sp. LS1]|uniref:DEAD/DEAH box helicase n=1 Tax=Paenibacillus sp. LS1 TaxID=2992120 RepID=UPI002230CF7C|nr:DEAD/DEAH box helicase family protein [Paenibacillus sp. LS1]MCW3791092.1 DEAD/DEAH box helicase family protein [Paenibacillus sp. LS1]